MAEALSERLSRYFTLDEMTLSETAVRYGIANIPGPDELANLRQLCARLDQVRELLGHPVIIKSGYRSKALNRAVNGSRNSAHVFGLAADIRCPDFGSPLAVCRAIAGSGIEFDQVIHEFGRWCHLGLAKPGFKPRRQLLTINDSGTSAGLA